MATGASGGSVKIQVDDADVRKGLNASVEGSRVAMRAAFNDAGALLQNAMRSRLERDRKVDTGGLRDSIRAIVADRRGRQFLEVGPDEAHATQGAVIEMGRRAGAPMPPAGALLPWMERHGIAAELEFVVRRNISERGTQPFPFAAPALDENAAPLDALWAGVLDVIERAWAKG